MERLIVQNNYKITKGKNINIEKIISEMKDDEKILIAHFYYDKIRQRNRYRYSSLAKKDLDLSVVCDKNYRGDIQVELWEGKTTTAHLFVTGFSFPVYKTEIVTMVCDSDNNITYKKIESQLTFKLKNSEDRLAFDVSIKTFDEPIDIVTDNYIAVSYSKALKIPLSEM